MNKRGQGLSTSTIILLVLGIIILVILVLGFTLGWSSLTPFLKTSNVDNLESACSLACSLDYTDDYCNVKRELRLSADRETEFLIDKNDYTCYQFANFGLIESCPSIQCKLCEGEGLTRSTLPCVNDGQTIEVDISNLVVDLNPGEYCCKDTS